MTSLSDGKKIKGIKPKEIMQVCDDCGAKYGTPPTRAIGKWQGICDICGKDKGLAAAWHDYRIDAVIVKGTVIRRTIKRKVSIGDVI